MIRSLSVRRVPRPLAVVLSVALAAVALPVLASPASAAVPTFEVEGNLLVDTTRQPRLGQRDRRTQT